MIFQRLKAWGVAILVGMLAINAEGALGGAVPEAESAVRESSKQDTLVGLWYARQQPGPMVRGELRLQMRNGTGRADIGTYSVPVQLKGDQLRFRLADGMGEFRGRIEGDDQTIQGHWIQPAGAVSHQPRATPVKLVASDGANWIGMIAPLDETVHFYVQVRRRSNGSLTGVIRCPEQGGWGRSEFAVELTGNEVVLSSAAQRIHGWWDRHTERLSLSLNPDRTLLFRRCTEGEAVGYYPRMMPRRGGFELEVPAALADGWGTASLDEVAIARGPIQALIGSILDADPADPQSLPIHSLLIARRNRLVVEEYFYGFHRERPHDMRSAGKTLAPLLVGVARYHGAQIEPDTRVADLFPEYRPFEHWDERKSKLTVRDLMTMTSGLASDDNDPASPGSEDRLQELRAQPDWYRYTLNLPMRREPGGTNAVYSSASLNLVGGVAGRAAGLWNAELFYRHLARPLQLGPYHLNLMPSGDVYTGGGAYLLPRDQLKLGQLYLDGGRWHGVRVLGEEWVRRSTEAHATFETPVIEIDRNHQYGYGWHIHHYAVAGRTVRAYAAEGNGGQFIIVLPEFEMVVAVNAGGYGSSSWYRWGLEVVPKYLIPAVAGPSEP